MGRKHRDFPKDESEQKLKDKVRRLISDNKKLLAENRTLEKALEKTHNYVKKKMSEITVEEAISHADSSLEELQESVLCSKCKHDTILIVTPGTTLRLCKSKECKHREIIRSDSYEQHSTKEVL